MEPVETILYLAIVRIDEYAYSAPASDAGIDHSYIFNHSAIEMK